MDAIKSKTYCEKWPVGCQFCDLFLCDGKKEKYEVVTMNKAGIPGEVLTFEYDHKCVPCKPTQPECGECEFAHPITNADRIRAMTDEELADFLGGIFTIETDIWGDYDPRLVVTQDPRVEIRDKEGMVDWLKSPMEEYNG